MLIFLNIHSCDLLFINNTCSELQTSPTNQTYSYIVVISVFWLLHCYSRQSSLRNTKKSDDDDQAIYSKYRRSFKINWFYLLKQLIDFDEILLPMCKLYSTCRRFFGANWFSANPSSCHMMLKERKAIHLHLNLCDKTIDPLVVCQKAPSNSLCRIMCLRAVSFIWNSFMHVLELIFTEWT